MIVTNRTNSISTIDDFKKDNEMMFDYLEFFLNFKPYDYQKKFLIACLTKKRIAGKWSRQSGKSLSVAAYCTFICSITPTSIMITAPTQTQSSELYGKIRTLVNKNPAILSSVVKLTQTEMVWSNGSRIKALPSGPEGKSIRGFTADIVVQEEAGIQSDEITNSVIVPMLASKGVEGQLIKIGTPLTKNHFYKSCYEDSDYEVIKVTWEDCIKAKQYDIKFIEEQRNNLTDVEFQTEYEAKFVEESSLFFPSILLKSCMEEYSLIRVF